VVKRTQQYWLHFERRAIFIANFRYVSQRVVTIAYDSYIYCIYINYKI